MTLAVCLSNRRDRYIHDALASLRTHVTGCTSLIVVDDTGDIDWQQKLAAIEDVEVLPVADEPAGYTRAMQAVWSLATGQRFLFVEEDFRFTRPLNLAVLHAVLDSSPWLAQVALQRQPWYRREQQIGVLAAQRERVDAERGTPTIWTDHGTHVEHTAGITCNPSLWSAAATGIDWPSVAWSETEMGERLLAAGLSSAWYGREGDPPHVEHVGHQRAEHSTGY